MNSTRTRQPSIGGAKQQQGVALVIALVFLLLLTIIGVTAMQNATLQERMAGNVRDRNVGLQSAEFALRDAEQVVDDGVSTAAGYVFATDDAPDWRATDCAGGDVSVVADAGLNAEVDSAPCYFAEEFVSAPLVAGSGDAELRYRITALATGRSPDTRVVVRSSYRTVGN